MRIPGTRTLRTARHWARTRFSRRALILGYHRIANAESDPFDMCTPPARFDAQVRWLRSEAEPLSLGEAVSALSEDRLPRRGVVVTLDDGYADSLHAARPVLEAHGVPATVFVTVGILGREPWWDTLERTVRNAPEAPRSLRIDPFLSWNAGSAAGASARDSLVHASHRVLADLGEAERDDLLERLAVALGAADGAGATARGLAEEELRQLARSEGIEIGAHSRTHPMLARLPVEQQREEIVGSRRLLTETTGTKVESFAYPHGSHSDTTRALVRDAGFDCACASAPGVAWGRSDPFALPRFWWSSLEIDAFARAVRWWWDG